MDLNTIGQVLIVFLSVCGMALGTKHALLARNIVHKSEIRFIFSASCELALGMYGISLVYTQSSPSTFMSFLFTIWLMSVPLDFMILGGRKAWAFLMFKPELEKALNKRFPDANLSLDVVREREDSNNG